MDAHALLTRGVATIISSKEELEKRLESDKKLTVYMGIDPTATRIHLGHSVTLRKLQAFANLGHHVIFLIGDFTALIGDTSDKDTERPVLTPEQIQENFKTYKKQAEKILDFSKVSVVYNSEWLKKLTLEEIIKLCQHFAVGDFVGRELIRKRLTANKRVGLHEVLYPVMQGYDSYHLDTDIQIGGTDQIFNMQAGRTLQKDLRNKDSFILTMHFLQGTDGRKMSKSWGNAIWLDDEPYDIYRKIMAIDDELIVSYYTLATNIASERIEQIESELAKTDNPMHIKKSLAHQIVTELHDRNIADAASEAFERIVQNKELPESTREFIISQSMSSGATITEILTASGIVPSNSQAKSITLQGGVSFNGEIVKNPNSKITQEGLLKVGKRNSIKIKK